MYGEGGGRDVKRRCSRVAAAAVLDPRPGPFCWRWGFPQTPLPGLPPARRSLRRAASWGRREGDSGGGQGPRARFRRRCRLPSSCPGLWHFTFSQYTYIICNLSVFLCMYMWKMGDPGLANGSQELPGPGVPKAVYGGRRSATVMLPLLPHPEGEASVVW